jgi:hypothetical protein
MVPFSHGPWTMLGFATSVQYAAVVNNHRKWLLIYAIFSSEVQFGQRLALVGIAVKQ